MRGATAVLVACLTIALGAKTSGIGGTASASPAPAAGQAAKTEGPYSAIGALLPKEKKGTFFGLLKKMREVRASHSHSLMKVAHDSALTAHPPSDEMCAQSMHMSHQRRHPPCCWHVHAHD